jgi:HAMP domain-containing protein
MSPNLSEPILKDEIEAFHTRQIGGKAVRIGVFRDQELTLHVGAELKEIEQLGWEIARSLVIVIPIVLLLIAAGSWWLGSVALTPIENIRRAAERITAERLDERIPSHGPADEIGRLVNVLNATFERLQGSFEQAARFSADASHQLKHRSQSCALALKRFSFNQDYPTSIEKVWRTCFNKRAGSVR